MDRPRQCHETVDRCPPIYVDAEHCHGADDGMPPVVTNRWIRRSRTIHHMDLEAVGASVVEQVPLTEVLEGALQAVRLPGEMLIDDCELFCGQGLKPRLQRRD